MIKRLNLKYIVFGFAIAVIIGFLVSWLSGLSFWTSFMLVAVAVILNGILTEYEDNLPGGFNNPMSKDEIKIEIDRRRKRFLPKCIGIWVIFIVSLIILVLLYWIKAV